jgi:hypothetical protein
MRFWEIAAAHLDVVPASCAKFAGIAIISATWDRFRMCSTGPAGETMQMRTGDLRESARPAI